MLDRIEQTIRERIRPRLELHGGDIRVLGFEDGVVRFELMGRCSGCPAASLTTEDMIREELTEAIPEVRDVALVERIDEDLLEQARAFLSGKRL